MTSAIFIAAYGLFALIIGHILGSRAKERQVVASNAKRRAEAEAAKDALLAAKARHAL